MDMDEIKQRVLEDVDPPSRKKKRKRIIRVMIQTLIEFISMVLVKKSVGFNFLLERKHLF